MEGSIVPPKRPAQRLFADEFHEDIALEPMPPYEVRMWEQHPDCQPIRVIVDFKAEHTFRSPPETLVGDLKRYLLAKNLKAPAEE